MSSPRRPAPAAAPWARRPAPGDAADPSSATAGPPVPAPEPGPEDPAAPRPGIVSAVLTSVLTGAVVGSVATAMHGGIWYLPGGLWLPWGLVFSGALLGFASVWSATTTRRVWAGAVPGLVTYVLAWSFAYLKNGSALVVTTWDAPIGIVGYAWFAVIFVAVLAAVIVTGRHLGAQRGAAPARGHD